MDSGHGAANLANLLEQINTLCESLDVDAWEHREGEDSDTKKTEELVSNYASTLEELLEHVKSLPAFLKGCNKDDRRGTLKELVPAMLTQVTAHCGTHYWTSDNSRRNAHAVISLVALACGCRTVLELLCGEGSLGVPTSSPYLPAGEVHRSTDTVAEASPYGVTVSDVGDTGELKTGTGVRLEHEQSGPETESRVPSGGEASSGGVSGITSAQHEGEIEHSVESSPEGSGDHPEVLVRAGVGVKETGSKLEVIFKAGLLKAVLSILKTKLTRDSWKRHPTAKHALVWCLKHLRHPHVGPYIDLFLPPLLMLLDDHEVYHKTLGLSAMTHLIRNVDPTELRWYGRANVIYEAIKKFLYINDPDLINALHPCMVILLPVVEGPPSRTSQGPKKPNKFDEVFSVFLNSLDFETKIAVRRAYIAHVNSYIRLLGIFTIRYLKRLLSVLFACMEFPDYCGEETRQYALKSLATLMKYTWPRIPYHKESILKALLKLISDLCPTDACIPDQSAVQRQLPLITQCLVILPRCCKDMENNYRTLLVDCTHEGLSLCLHGSLKEIDSRHKQ